MGSWFGLLFVLMGFIWSCYGYNTFYVGGKHGWILKTMEDYNQWSQRNRFQVNDTLVFKYRKGHNSVLVVTEENYKNCNKSHPIQSLEYHYGHSEMKLDRLGPFYFISGHNHNCHNGQKLTVVVLAVRNHSLSPTPVAPAPSMIPPSSIIPPAFHAPAPAPAPHASKASGVSVRLFLGLMSLVLGTFAGLL